MAAETEPAKLLLPYLQRADELQNHEPLVAYYCRLYAMERGMKIPTSERTKTTTSLLVSLMNQLEKDKKSLKLSPDDHLHLEGFALNVFAKADKQDRAGRGDMNTAKTFYAASIFFEILNQFRELAPDLEQKQKYAAWKAADIRKAIKEGRKPVPGPPGDENDTASLSSIPSAGYDLAPSQTEENINPGPESDVAPSPRSHGEITRQSSVHNPPSPPPYPTFDHPSHPSEYPSQNYQSSHPPENHPYPQPYQTQSYPQEPQHHFPQNYSPHDIPGSFSYPNFQSYPSFAESSLPAAPSHYPSYYQGSDASYSQQSAPSATSYPSPPQYSTGSRNGSAQDTPPATAQTYNYDSSYQPLPEKIAEAHKAARFAVGALAFDDVFIAVDYLKKSLELLTNPSAGQ